MIQLQVLSGKPAGSDTVVRHFPFLIGRAAEAQLRLEEPGVWERHLKIDFQHDAGFSFVAQEAALTLINGVKVERGTLRNGDLIELGSVRLRFWLARSEQKSLRLREACMWGCFVVLIAGQIGLICWLLR